jgi:toxin ParE2
MNSILLSEARAELIEASQYYESCQVGLGQRFLDSVDRAVDDVEQYPRRWPRITRTARRRHVASFPYGLVYRITRKEIVILAVMHLHRRPSYWASRWKGRQWEVTGDS